MWTKEKVEQFIINSGFKPKENKFCEHEKDMYLCNFKKIKFLF